MNILVVNNPQLAALPPARNLVESLLRLGHQVTLITKDDSKKTIEQQENLKIIIIEELDKKNPINAILSYLYRCFKLKRLVEREMQYNDILWTTTDKSIRDLRGTVLKYKHVMQLAELIEDIPVIPGQNLFYVNAAKYARNAFRVVVPEYNRAHIQKVWWNLKDTPKVLPNRMSIPKFEDYIPYDVQKVRDELSKERKKIILYQGIFGLDRELEVYAKAIETMQDEYAFYIMGRNAKGYQIETLIKKYPFIKIIDHINAPYHLAITQMAYIGLLPYKANKVSYLSILNAVFCAPNKIYEYSAYGIPMIGTEVPGLTIPFEIYKCGCTVSGNSEQEVIDSIKFISNNYETMSNNCEYLYKNCDFDRIVKEILGES